MAMSDLDAILHDLRVGSFKVSDHADDRMMERGIYALDIQNVGHTMEHWELQSNGCYRIEGESCEGDLIKIVCSYDGDTTIVTVLGD